MRAPGPPVTAPASSTRRLPRLTVSGGTALTIGLIAVLVHPAVAGTGAFTALGAVLISVAVGLMLIVSVLCHELAHALTARAFGARIDQIALTLWGGHTSYSGGRIGPWASALIAVVGPLTNAALALLAQLLQVIPAGPGVSTVLFYGVLLNGGLAVFNLLPGLPMDGGRALEGVLGAITGRRTLGTIITAWIGRAIAVAVIAIPLIRLLRSGGSVDILVLVWALVIAGTLWQGASSALAAARAERSIEAVDLRALVRPALFMDQDQGIDRIPEGIDPRAVLVCTAGTVRRRIDPGALAAVPPSEHTRARLADVSCELRTLGVIDRADLAHPDRAGEALRGLLTTRDPEARLAVREADGSVLGVILAADVIEHLAP